MSKQKDNHSDDAIVERWQELQRVLRGDEPDEEQKAANDRAIAALKEKEAAAWRDTTNDRPLFGK